MRGGFVHCQRRFCESNISPNGLIPLPRAATPEMILATESMLMASPSQKDECHVAVEGLPLLIGLTVLSNTLLDMRFVILAIHEFDFVS